MRMLDHYCVSVERAEVTRAVRPWRDGAAAAATEKLARLPVGLQSDDRTVFPALCAQPAPPSSGR